jgi:FKBP-type peptidyl-prolyl cis-trans isomerase (trigger factor)
MNKQIRELAEQASIEIEFDDYGEARLLTAYGSSLEKFVELIKQSIYDKVKEELIPDEVIAEEQVNHQEYLKGCNAGIVDALCYIKQFGVDE